MYWILKRLDLDGGEKIIQVSAEKPTILDVKGLIHQPEGGVYSTEYVQSILDGNTNKNPDAYEWFELASVEPETEVTSLDYCKAKSPRAGVLGWSHYHSASHGSNTEGFCVDGSILVDSVEMNIYFIRSGEKYFQVIDEPKALRSIVDRFVAQKLNSELVE